MFDIYTTLIVLALGVLTFLGLRTVLGVRMGRGRPPQRTGKQPVDTSEPLDRYDGVAMPGSPLAKALDAIMAADKNFDVSHFLAGARSAYEMIVMAYADGDRQVLTNLLTPGVYEGFEAVIREREARSARVETRFLSIDATSITAAELRGKVAHITMRFVSQLVSATRDRKGNVIDGSADNVTGVTDVWTFARNVTSRDPNWKLAATKNGA